MHKYAFALMIGNGAKAINVSMGFGNSSSIESYIQNGADIFEKFLEKLIKKNYEFVIVNSAGNSAIDAQYNHFFTAINSKSVKVELLLLHLWQRIIL